MRVFLFALFEYVSAGVIFVLGTVLYLEGYETETDRFVANVMYMVTAVWLFAIGCLTANGREGFTRPDHYSRKDWFVQETIIHGDWYISVGLGIVTLTFRAFPELPLEFLRFVLGMAAAAWILGVAVLAHKVSCSDNIKPIFVKPPRHLEDLSRKAG